MNKRPSKDRQRNAPKAERYRTLTGSASRAPSTLNEEERSVDVVMSTEEVVNMGYYDEVLLMSGASGPEQIPLLDSHSRWSVKDQLGSTRNIRKENDQLIGTAIYASDDDSQNAFTKMREGHATDYSIGYRIKKETFIERGQTGIVDGKTFTARESHDLYIVTEWEYKELSQTPIGADPQSKARNEHEVQNPPKETKTMHTKVRAYLESIGLSATATEEEAARFMADLPEATRKLAEAEETRSDDAETSKPKEEGTRQTPAAPKAKTVQVDTGARAASILAAGRSLGLIDEASKLLEDTPAISEQEAFRQLHAVIAERSQAAPRPSVQVIADQGDKIRAAGVDALLMNSKVGIGERKAAPGASELRGFNLREMAREVLRMNGMRVDGNIHEMVGRAMTTDDFSYILSNVANKSLDKGWDTNPETWSTCFDTDTVSDFKTNSKNRVSEFDDLDEVKEGGEYKYGSLTDSKEEYILAKYGKLFSITREAIINDDLSSLTDTPMKMGEAASRKVGDVAWGVFTANANMGDGTALFHADHGNLASSGAVVSVTTLGAGQTAMALQKDARSLRRLNIRPQYYISPVTAETSAEVFFQSQLIGTQALPTQKNIFAGNYLTRVYEPRLDDTSTTAWYLAGAKGKTVTVFFLNGAERPYMESKNGFNVDGVEYKVRIEATAKALDWRGVYKNAGA